MHTRIVIKHDTIAALKASPLWKEIMAIAFEGGAVSVVEIVGSEDEPDQHDDDHAELVARSGAIGHLVD